LFVEQAIDRKVRGTNGLVPWREGATPVAIREWREAQTTAGKPSSLDDFYAAHRICADWSGHGVKMIGRSDPATPVDIQSAGELGLEQLPPYDLCPTCQGSAKR
jgi:hypothetical protein